MSDTEYTADVNVTEDITPDVDGGNATSSAVDMDDILLSADVSPDELIDVELYSDEPINTDVRDTVGSSETDHRLLTHRDAPDQHPMTAITGLNTSLQNMAASIDSRLTADENGIILLQVETDGHTQRLNVVEDDVVDAAKTATNYVTALSSTGIKLHAEDSATLNYITLDGTDGMEVHKSGENVASFGDTVRIGLEDDQHLFIDENGVKLYSGASSIASFSDITRIGYADGAHLSLDADGIRGYSSGGNLYFSINKGALGTIYTYMNALPTMFGEDGVWTSTAGVIYLNKTNSTRADVYAAYTALATGGAFRILAEYYARDAENKTVNYATRVFDCIKGTYSYALDGGFEYTPRGDEDDYIKFLQEGRPRVPDGYRGYYGVRPFFGISRTDYMPFYRFGVDVAETGGESSFVMGTGTQANNSNELALGIYNDSTTGSVLTVGKGVSDSLRSNALRLDYSGNLAISGSLTQASDRRLKEHIGYLGEDAVEFVRQLKPAHFIKDSAHHVGFYAQDVESADKWHCMTDEMNGFKTLGYTEVIAPLVAYCQSLEERIEELERN